MCEPIRCMKTLRRHYICKRGNTMTSILVDIDGIDGDLSVGTLTNKVAALGIQDVVLATGGDTETQLSEVCVFRIRDLATPKIMKYAAAGTLISTVKIHILDADNASAFKWSMEEVYVSRFECDTPETGGIAYGPHLGKPNVGAADWASGSSTSTDMHDDRRYANARARPNPRYLSSYPGVYQEGRIERVWFNASKIQWYAADGQITKGWNVTLNEAWD